jgi:cytochrome c2
MFCMNVFAWGLRRHPTIPVLYVRDANPDRGRTLIRDHGCGACHVVPGVGGATGNVGPRLDDLKANIYIAGVVPNTPDHLIEWIMNPKEVDPLTAMPDLDINESQARDIAAYLYHIP